MNSIHSFLRICVVLASLVIASAASAQMSSAQRDYYEDWTIAADRAERVIDVGEASNAALENLRSEMATYREQFLSARSQDAARIKTLQSQLDALGDVPEEGEEPADIAELRQSLSDQLNSLLVPKVVGEEAYSRANGLIGEIDRIIRERQASQLLSRGPNPLNPVYWGTAWEDVRTALAGLAKETTTAWQNAAKHQTLLQHWPGVALLMVLGTILMVQGTLWSERLGDYLRGFGGKGSGVWSFIVSLLRILLPFIGILLFCEGLSLSGMLGLRGDLLLDAIPRWGAVFLVFRWIGDQISSRDHGYELDFKQPDHEREMQILLMALAVTLVMHDGVLLFEQIENVSNATRAVVGFPPILFGALILLRLQKISRYKIENRQDETDDKDRHAGFSKVIDLLRRGLVVMAIASPVLAGLGYLNAAEAIIYPAILTLVVISLVLELQVFLGVIYGLVSGKGAAAQDSLFVVLVGFVLTLLSLPVLAIIWGARVVDLTELWERFLAGFRIGGVQISPTDFITFALIFGIGYSLTRLLQGGLRNSLLPKTSIDPGGQNAIVSGTGYVGVTLAALAAVTGTGLDLSSLAIVAGALSVGIGFGLQTIVSNFVSGIILLVERPISKGDWIEVGGLMGYVRDISVRSTRIETFDRTDVIVPNADLVSGTVTNYTRGNTIGRVIAPVGVAYGTDTKRVEGILREIANSHPMVLANPPPSVVFQGFGASSLDFEIRAILRDVNWVLSVKSDLNHEIARRFSEENIEIPFAQTDIWLRNPETISASSRPAPEHMKSEVPQGGEADDL